MAYEMTSKKQMPFSEVMNTDMAKKQILNVLQDPKRAARFTSSVISAVSATPALKECEPTSILSAALLGESLELSPSPQLGHYYMVPFQDRNAGISKATFILGWRGYIQLAARSGMYKRIVVFAVKRGEVVKPFNIQTEQIELSFIENEDVRVKSETVGYYAAFEYINGFQKAMYWTKEKMMHHALTYSKGFAAKKGYTFWEKDFDEMGNKTMIRQLIGKWGIMSIELRQAFEADTDTDEPPDFDSMKDVTPKEPQPTQPETKKRIPKKADPERSDADESELPFTLSDDDTTPGQEDMFDLENG
jgi:recombination protein RecT